MNDLKKRFPTYSKLLSLYPKAYRDKYSQSILQTTADTLDDLPSVKDRLSLWLHISLELPISVTKQQLQYLGDNMHIPSANNIKGHSLIASTLLIPFFAALIANGLDKVLYNHTLYKSWLWHTPLINIWVLYLPLIAFLIVIVSYINFIFKYHKTAKQSSWWNGIFNIKRLWPLLVPAGLALGILFILAFHDSGQCWVHTPTYITSHWHNVWQCTTNNQSVPVFRKLF